MITARPEPSLQLAAASLRSSAAVAPTSPRPEAIQGRAPRAKIFAACAAALCAGWLAGCTQRTGVTVPPMPTIAVPSPVTAGATGLIASVAAEDGDGLTYAWTITGGTITSAGGTAGVTSSGRNAITFTAGAPGTIALSCVAIDSALEQSVAAQASVLVLPAPVTPTITTVSSAAAGAPGLTASVVARAGMAYAWTLADGTVTSAGALAGVTAGGTNTLTFTAGAPGTLTLTCVELNAADAQSSPATAAITIDAATFAVTVALAGTGTGTVTSSPAGISCGNSCVGNYSPGTTVTLTATPSGSSTFTGFSGDCTGATCSLTVSAAKDVTATFGVALQGNLGDLAVVAGNALYKLSASDGSVLWGPVTQNNCGTAAVDPVDFGVYTAATSHCGDGTGSGVYKFDASGDLAWNAAYSACGIGGAYYIGNGGISVDATSATPGVVLTMSGYYGNFGKVSRSDGATLWCNATDDLARPSLDPSNGQSYAITNAGNYDYQTIYSNTSSGTQTSAAVACEGFTEMNPADGALYMGGSMTPHGCGTTLYEMDRSTLGATLWSADLSATLSSIDALAAQPWSGGYVYVASVGSSLIAVVDPATQTVVSTFAPAVPPALLAVNPAGGNLYIANGSDNHVYAYTPDGSLVWTSPALAANITNLAAPRNVVGTPPSTTAVWTLISSTGTLPPARIYGSTLAGLSIPILFAGNEGSGPASDTWALGAHETWSQLAPTGGPPPARDNHGAIFDAANDRMMIFGGCLGGCTPVASDLWVLSNADGTGGTPAWTKLSPTGTIPARQSFAMAYDSINNRALVFGGQDGSGSGGSTLTDVSVLTNANGLGGTPEWSQLTQSGSEAPGQYGPAWGYDNANARLIVMGGGARGSGVTTNAVYVLSNANGMSSGPSTWSNLVAEGASGAPPIGQGRPAAYDSVSNRFIQVGGAAPGDVWVLSNANGLSGTPVWTHLQTSGGPGAGFGAQGHLYDPATATMTVLFSGTVSGVTVNQIWQLTNAAGR